MCCARAMSCSAFSGRVTVETIEAVVAAAARIAVSRARPSARGDGADGAADPGPVVLPAGHRHRLSGRRSAQALRRGNLHHQSSGRVGAARDRRADRGDHRGRAIRLGLHRPDRHHARQRRNRRHGDAGAQRRRNPGHAARSGARDHAAASDLLCRCHGRDRRRRHELFRSRHRRSRNSCASSKARSMCAP